MGNVVRWLTFGASVSTCLLGAWQVCIAQGNGFAMLSSPFIAAESKDSKYLQAGVSSNAKRSPYTFRTNSTVVPESNYAGLLITNGYSEPVSLQNLSFDYKGAGEAKAVVVFNRRPSFSTTAHARSQIVSLDAGTSSAKTADGYRRVSCSASQLHLPADNLIEKIVLIAPPKKKAGLIALDNLNINMAPVNKAMESLFFSVSGGSPTGPAGANPQAAGGGGGSSTGTGLRITNGASSSVTAWLTLPTGCDPGTTCHTDVKGLFPNMTYSPAGQTASGYQVLSGGQSITYKPSSNPPTQLQGALVSFNAAPSCAVTVAEATLNTGVGTQETVDISLVNGNNASIRMSCPGTAWTTNFGFVPYKGPFQNFVGDNLLISGVYPAYCSNCTYTAVQTCGTASSCNPPNGCNPYQPPYSTNPSATCPQCCQFQRDGSKSGGLVNVKYLGPPQPLPTQASKRQKIQSCYQIL